MSILEILEAHTVKRPWSEASRMRCKCGEVVTAEAESQLYALHRAHVAQVLEQHEREAKADAWNDGWEDGKESVHNFQGKFDNNPYKESE